MTTSDDELREKVTRAMDEGLETMVEPFPEDNHAFDLILKDLRKLDKDDWKQRLVISGYVNHPVDMEGEEFACRECTYYIGNRRWCELPELDLPAEDDWWCRLWRV